MFEDKIQKRQQYAKEKRENELAELKERLLFQSCICEILSLMKFAALSLKYVSILVQC